MLKPFDFQCQLRDHFKRQEKTWNWFSQVTIRNEQVEEFKTSLLKNTYRLEEASEPLIHRLVAEAKSKLGVIVPVTVYQSQYSQSANAGIIFIGNEAHLLLSGPLIRSLEEKELLALIAHELSHILFYTLDGGDFEVTSRIITAIGNDYRSGDTYAETSRLFSLFTELFCDIGSFEVCGDSAVVISALVKIDTGLEKVSAANYVKQADEIFARHDQGSGGESHPESFIRAKAIDLYARNGAAAFDGISRMILGNPGLFSLNIFMQQALLETTRELIQLLLKPKWMQSELNKAHYQQYFREFKTNSAGIADGDFKARIGSSSASLKEYYCYVMLDFALCDTEISTPASGLILDLAEQLGLSEPLTRIFKKELNLSDKKFNEYVQAAASELNAIMESDQEKIY
ncbi:M48 family metalloprotease [Hufsiella ginkgonis]|uniref:M48 family metalloprotease n=1 Tax=Hufsiella ginkgonis TaxID=2695274 RepID=A0A7K1XZZ0_9SPHI|nr:M48 family metalloprotease [Hufsiella ginkgonis]MXV16584.1 M48 family metalloprotease [Hufsiella ginkgonis]